MLILTPVIYKMVDKKKVAIIGPECTGKSELSRYLAEHFETEWVPEYARAYLDKLMHPYTQDDLLKIAHGQLRLEDEYTMDANNFLICDTNLYVIKIWSMFKYGNCQDEILKTIASRKYDLYLLTYVDIPWQEDPLREHPTNNARPLLQAQPQSRKEIPNRNSKIANLNRKM